MLTEQEKLDGVTAAVRSYVPRLSLALKSRSWFHRFISKILSLFGNKLYMDLYWTSIGKTIYRPRLCDTGPLLGEWRVILHEGRHIDDCYKLGLPLYCFLYLFPQVIGFLGVLYAAVILPILLLGGPLALLWGLLSLLFLAPLPAPARAIIEARGYVVSMACDFWCGSMGSSEGVYLDNLTNRFTTGAYYWMWPFRKAVRKYFENRLEDLYTNALEMDSYLMMCKTKCSVYR